MDSFDNINGSNKNTHRLNQLQSKQNSQANHLAPIAIIQPQINVIRNNLNQPVDQIQAKDNQEAQISQPHTTAVTSKKKAVIHGNIPQPQHKQDKMEKIKLIQHDRFSTQQQNLSMLQICDETAIIIQNSKQPVKPDGQISLQNKDQKAHQDSRSQHDKTKSKNVGQRQRLQEQIALSNNSLVGFGNSQAGNETVTNSPNFLNNSESPFLGQIIQTGENKLIIDRNQPNKTNQIITDVIVQSQTNMIDQISTVRSKDMTEIEEISPKNLNTTKPQIELMLRHSSPEGKAYPNQKLSPQNIQGGNNPIQSSIKFANDPNLEQNAAILMEALENSRRELQQLGELNEQVKIRSTNAQNPTNQELKPQVNFSQPRQDLAKEKQLNAIINKIAQVQKREFSTNKDAIGVQNRSQSWGPVASSTRTSTHGHAKQIMSKTHLQQLHEQQVLQKLFKQIENQTALTGQQLIDQQKATMEAILMTGGLLRKIRGDQNQLTAPELALQTITALGGLPGQIQGFGVPIEQLSSLVPRQDPDESQNVTGRGKENSSQRAATDLEQANREANISPFPTRVEDYDHILNQINSGYVNRNIRSSFDPDQVKNYKEKSSLGHQREFMKTTQMMALNSFIGETDKTNSVDTQNQRLSSAEINNTRIQKQQQPKNPQQVSYGLGGTITEPTEAYLTISQKNAVQSAMPSPNIDQVVSPNIQYAQDKNQKHEEISSKSNILLKFGQQHQKPQTAGNNQRIKIQQQMMSVKSGVMPQSGEIAQLIRQNNSQLNQTQVLNVKPWSNLNGKNIELQNGAEIQKGAIQNVISQVSRATTTQNTMHGQARGRLIQRSTGAQNPNSSHLSQQMRGKRQSQTQGGSRPSQRLKNNHSVIDQQIKQNTQISDYGALSMLSQISAKMNSQEKNERELKNSVKFLDEFSMKEINQRLYSRDGNLDQNQAPFFIKEMKKDRMVRINRSHNMRAKDQIYESQKFTQNCRPIKQNYIYSRMAQNQKHIEKCTARRMILFEKQLLEEKQRGNEFIKQMNNTHELFSSKEIVPMANIDKELRPTSQQRDQDATFDFQSQLENTGKAKRASVDELRVISHSPYIKQGTFATNEIQSGIPENQQINNQVYSRHQTDGSSEAASPCAIETNEVKENEDSNQRLSQKSAVKNQKKIQNLQAQMTYVIGSDTQARSKSPIQEDEIQSNAVSRAKTSCHRNYAGIQTHLNWCGITSQTSPGGVSNQRLSKFHPRQKSSIINSNQNEKYKRSHLSVKHSEGGEIQNFDFNQLSEINNLFYYQMANNVSNVPDVNSSNGAKTVLYQPIQSKIQRLNSQTQMLAQNRFKFNQNNSVQVQQVLNDQKARLAKLQQKVKSRAESEGPCLQSKHSVDLNTDQEQTRDINQLKMIKVVQNNCTKAQASYLDKEKPMWSLSKNLNSNLLNHKTEPGQMLAKLSTGDHYKLHRMLQDQQNQQVLDKPESQQAKQRTKSLIESKDENKKAKQKKNYHNEKSNKSKFGKNRSLIQDFDDLNLDPQRISNEHYQNGTALSNKNDISSLYDGQYGIIARSNVKSVIMKNKIPTASQEPDKDSIIEPFAQIGGMHVDGNIDISKLYQNNLIDNFKIQDIIKGIQEENVSTNSYRQNYAYIEDVGNKKRQLLLIGAEKQNDGKHSAGFSHRQSKSQGKQALGSKATSVTNQFKLQTERDGAKIESFSSQKDPSRNAAIEVAKIETLHRPVSQYTGEFSFVSHRNNKNSKQDDINKAEQVGNMNSHGLTGSLNESKDDTGGSQKQVMQLVKIPSPSNDLAQEKGAFSSPVKSEDEGLIIQVVDELDNTQSLQKVSEKPLFIGPDPQQNDKEVRELVTLSPKANNQLSPLGSRHTGSPISTNKNNKVLESKSSNSKIVFQNKRGSVSQYKDEEDEIQKTGDEACKELQEDYNAQKVSTHRMVQNKAGFGETDSELNSMPNAIGPEQRVGTLSGTQDNADTVDRTNDEIAQNLDSNQIQNKEFVFSETGNPAQTQTPIKTKIEHVAPGQKLAIKLEQNQVFTDITKHQESNISNNRASVYVQKPPTNKLYQEIQNINQGFIIKSISQQQQINQNVKSVAAGETPHKSFQSNQSPFGKTSNQNCPETEELSPETGIKTSTYNQNLQKPFFQAQSTQIAENNNQSFSNRSYQQQNVNKKNQTKLNNLKLQCPDNAQQKFQKQILVESNSNKALKKLNEAFRKPIHENPPKYLQNENFGQKYRFLAKHRRTKTTQNVANQNVSEKGSMLQSQRAKNRTSGQTTKSNLDRENINIRHLCSQINKIQAPGHLLPRGIVVEEQKSPKGTESKDSPISPGRVQYDGQSILSNQTPLSPPDSLLIDQNHLQFNLEDSKDGKQPIGGTGRQINAESKRKHSPRVDININTKITNPQQAKKVDSKIGKAVQAFNSRTSSLDPGDDSYKVAPINGYNNHIFKNKQISQHQEISKTVSVDSQLSAKAFQNNFDGSYLPAARIPNQETYKQADKLKSNQTGIDNQEFMQLQILQKYLDKEKQISRNSHLSKGQSSKSPTSQEINQKNLEIKADEQKKQQGVTKGSNDLKKRVVTDYQGFLVREGNFPKTVDKMISERKQIKTIQSKLAAEFNKNQNKEKSVVVLVSQPGQNKQLEQNKSSIQNSRSPSQIQETQLTASIKETQDHMMTDFRKSSGTVEMTSGIAVVQNADASQSAGGMNSMLEKVRGRTTFEYPQITETIQEISNLNQQKQLIRNLKNESSEKTEGKISLDSVAIDELIQNPDFTQNYQLDEKRANYYDMNNSKEKQKQLKISLAQMGNQQDDSMFQQDKKLWKNERPLFTLPTSEIEDLYKEQKELTDAFKNNFGLIGRQTNISTKNQPRPPLQKFFEDKRNQEKKVPALRQIDKKADSIQNGQVPQYPNMNNHAQDVPSLIAEEGEKSPEIKYTAATNDDINTVIADDPFQM